MKRTISIIIGVCLFSFLFYLQTAGINLLLFTLSIIALFYYQYQEEFSRLEVKIFSSAVIIASAGAAYLGSMYSAWVAMICLSILPGVILYGRLTIIKNIVYSFFSAVSTPVQLFLHLKKANRKGELKDFLKLLTIIVPLVFILIFFSIYRKINPLFEKFTEDINLDFISSQFIWFTVIGFFILYGLFHNKRLRKLDLWYGARPQLIYEKKVAEPKWTEAKAYLVLFFILNVMLLLVNSLDLNYLYLGAGMPEGITHKQFVHNGVGMLIISILLGLLLLTFFFRGKLNFSSNSKLIKILGIVWLAQNAFMILSTTIRNTMYVNQALLTYKRLGVYVWLVLAFSGLFLMFLKLQKNKTIWYLITQNMYVVFTLFVLSATINWDGIIYYFNLKKAETMEDISPLDKSYLLSLDGNITDLFSISEKKGFNNNPIYSYRNRDNRNWLDSKIYYFMEDNQKYNWKSFSIENYNTKKELLKFYEKGGIQSLNLKSNGIRSLTPIFPFNKIKKLNLSGNYIHNELAGQINRFNQLEELNLRVNRLSVLDTLEENSHLRVLDLGHNNIQNLEFLASFKNLESLNLSSNKIISLSSLPTLDRLKSLDLSKNELAEIKMLGELKELSSLFLNNISTRLEEQNYPSLNNLKTLHLSNSRAILHQYLGADIKIPNLKHLDISNNDLSHISKFFDANKGLNLEKLMINNNRIRSLEDIDSLVELRELNATSNIIRTLRGLEKLTKIEALYLGLNSLQNINSISNYRELQHLELQHNYELTDFRALKQLKNLRYLDLTDTKFTDLELITSSKEIEELNLRSCKIENWEPIKEFKKLNKLHVSYLKKEDIKEISKLRQLKYLIVKNTEDRIYNLLKKEMKGLEDLEIRAY